MMDRTVAKSLMRCTTVLGRVYEVVQFHDGGWGVARDGQPLADLYWPAGELDDCVKAHNRMCYLEPMPEQGGASPSGGDRV